jgi:hypothetical protein
MGTARAEASIESDGAAKAATMMRFSVSLNSPAGRA